LLLGGVGNESGVSFKEAESIVSKVGSEDCDIKRRSVFSLEIRRLKSEGRGDLGAHTKEDPKSDARAGTRTKARARKSELRNFNSRIRQILSKSENRGRKRALLQATRLFHASW